MKQKIKLIKRNIKIGKSRRTLKNLKLLVRSVAIAGTMYLSNNYVFADDLKEVDASKNNLEVIVLDDSDSDYKNPPFNDDLYLIGKNGELIAQKSEFNISETSSGERSVAIAKDGSFIICENVARKMSRYDINGNLVFSVNEYITAVDISANGDLYCLLGSGTIYGDSVLIIDPVDGDIKKQAKYGGVDLVVDDRNDSVWIVGADIKRLNRNLGEIFSIDPIKCYAASVDYASDGTAWIAEGGFTIGDDDRLLNISLDGEINRTIELSFGPSCVAVDRNSDDIFVSGNKGVYKFDKNDKKTHISNSRAFGVRVNQRDGSIWVVGEYMTEHGFRGRKGVASMFGFEDFKTKIGFVNHYSKDGTLLDSIQLPEGQKFIGIVK